MDLIYEGITTMLVSSYSFHTSVRMDLIYEGITTRGLAGYQKNQNSSEWTWFTKGLRQEGIDTPFRHHKSQVRMDLIYEGITTFFSLSFLVFSVVRMDLIYEGITTQRQKLNCRYWLCQNGPDLRRDYDLVLKSINSFLSCQNGPDLRRDYDWLCIVLKNLNILESEWTWFTKGLRQSPWFLLQALLLSEWTWFTKGLRRRLCNSSISLKVSSQSEWTWFTKGLRPCDNPVEVRDIPVRMDLIYEGITTV